MRTVYPDPRRGRRSLRGLGLALSVAMVTALALGTAMLTSATTQLDGVHNDGVMETDGSIDFTGNVCDYNSAPIYPTVPSSTTCTPSADTTAPGSAPWDWSNIFNSSSPGAKDPTTGFYAGATAPYAGSPVASDPNFVDATFQPYNGDLFTQGSKDVNDVPSWTCTQQANPPKDQLANTYGAAFRAPTALDSVVNVGDTLLHMAIERPGTNGNANAGFWFFQQPVICNPATGKFSNGHSNNDLFMVGSFLGGGGNSVLAVYKWVCPTNGVTTACTGAGGLSLIGTDNAPCPVAGTGTPTGDMYCEVVNQNSTTINGKQQFETWNVNTPWNDGQNGTIPGPGFLELGIDLSAVFRSLSQSTPCFSSFLADTRSSGSSTQAETKDFINHSFPTCFPLHVHKYIDSNADGTDQYAQTSVPPTATDDTNGQSFTFKVYAGTYTTPPASTPTCSGTTGTDGYLSCTSGTLDNLQPGPYTIFETQKAGYYNTDPGTPSSLTFPHVNEAGTVYKQFTLGNASGFVDFGNDCYNSVGWKIYGAPAASTGNAIDVNWTVTSGYDSTSNTGGTAQSGTVTGLAAGSDLQGSYFGGTSPFNFVQGDVINWSWYYSNDPTHALSTTSSALTGCSSTLTTTFGPATLIGHKFKDITNLGVEDPTEPGLGGFSFALIPQGAALTTANMIGGAPAVSLSASSGALQIGDFSVSGVDPGTYTLEEVHQDTSGNWVAGPPHGWQETLPTASGVPTSYTVTVHLGDGNVTTTDSASGTAASLLFGNTPLSDISVTFTPETSPAKTKSTITCGSSSSTTGSLSLNAVNIGTYSCTVVITDP